MKTCSLCGQSFDEDDPLWPHRKKRHEQRHARTDPPTNQIVGTVVWE